MPVLDLNQPLAPPPAGIKSNLEHPSNEAGLAYTTLAVALAMVTLFSWFRFLVKLCIVEKLHFEDYLIPFAWLAAIGDIACGFLINQFAPIIHSWDITLYAFGRYLLWYRLSAIFYNVSILLIKVAMLIQVLRIFVPRGSQSKTHYVIKALIGANMVYYITAIFLMIFTCQPISEAWKPWLPGKCMPIGAIAMSTAVINLIGDLSILFLTQKAIWGLLQCDFKQRVKLSIVFCAGIVPCGFAVMCLYYNDRQMHSTDFMHDSALMSIACYGEIASGMFVLFLPVVPRFFTKMKQVSSLSASRSTHRRAPSALEFADVGSPNGPRVSKTAPKERERKQSLWHISYTQQESDDRLPLSPKRNDFEVQSLGSKSDTTTLSRSP